MKFLYCFANASLILRVLTYILRQVESQADSATVFFLNDRWVLHLTLKSTAESDLFYNCWAFLDEHGIPYKPNSSVGLALCDLAAGHPPTQVMNDYCVSIVSYGAPCPEEVKRFQEQLVVGLGYCPPSLI